MINPRLARAVFLSALINTLLCVGALCDESQLARATNSNRDLFVNMEVAFAGQSNEVALILTQMGFPPANAPETWGQWRRWPQIRMLEMAYFSAETAQKDSGIKILQKVARLIATHHNQAIRFEPSLSSFFPDPAGKELVENNETFRFGIPLPSNRSVRLPPETRKIIETIAKYTEAISPEYLMAQCCQLTPDETYDLLRKQSDYPSVFEAAVKLHAPPPSDQIKVSRLVQAVRVDNPAIALEPDFPNMARAAGPTTREAQLRLAEHTVKLEQACEQLAGKKKQVEETVKSAQLSPEAREKAERDLNVFSRAVEQGQKLTSAPWGGVARGNGRLRPCAIGNASRREHGDDPHSARLGPSASWRVGAGDRQ